MNGTLDFIVPGNEPKLCRFTRGYTDVYVIRTLKRNGNAQPANSTARHQVVDPLWNSGGWVGGWWVGGGPVFTAPWSTSFISLSAALSFRQEPGDDDSESRDQLNMTAIVL